MAKENIARFIDATMIDKALAEKFTALAAEYDYDFTVEELLGFGAVRPLSDENIAGVSGGRFGKGDPHF